MVQLEEELHDSQFKVEKDKSLQIAMERSLKFERTQNT